MRFYEITCLISPNLSEEDLKTFKEKIKAFIQEEGGVLVETKSPIKRVLGYSVKTKSRPKMETVYSVSLSFNLVPDKLENLEKKLKSESQLFRYLILNKKAQKVIPPSSKMPVASVPKMEKAKKEKVELKEIEEKLEEILGQA